jgi:SAM-dependent methyltransferase
MADPSLAPFADPTRHLGASEIIRRRSTNSTDVRHALLAGLDLAFARNILDLGCGFGFTAEAIARRAAPDAQIIGVDACPANAPLYLERIAATGRTARFAEQHIRKHLDWPNHAFDLVIASYALYFFPEVLPEVARVLSPGGLLFAVTHTENSCRDLLRAAGLPISDVHLLGHIRNFSAENGQARLSPWFTQIERVDYRNQLVFPPAAYDEFLTYLRFKLPLLLAESEPGGAVPLPLANAIRATLARQETIAFEKNDAAFRCRGPRCP